MHITPDRHTLLIGDIRIKARSADGQPLQLSKGDPHVAFLRDGGNSKADCILDWGAADLPPFTALGRPLFCHRSQWQVHADDQGGWLLPLIFPPKEPQLRRLARADADFSHIELLIPADDPYSGNPLACLFAELIVLGISSRKPLLLAHSVCLVRGPRAILALGQSGAGKSTLARLCRQERGWRVIGDEIHLLTQAVAFRVHGTPWPGTSGDYAPHSADLAAILLIEHGADNRLMPIAGSAAAAELLSHSFLPIWSEQAMDNAVTLAAAIAGQIPMYRFAFTPDASAAEYLAAFFAG